jgi:hypothetical protein
MEYYTTLYTRRTWSSSECGEEEVGILRDTSLEILESKRRRRRGRWGRRWNGRKESPRRREKRGRETTRISNALSMIRSDVAAMCGKKGNRKKRRDEAAIERAGAKVRLLAWYAPKKRGKLVEHESPRIVAEVGGGGKNYFEFASEW